MLPVAAVVLAVVEPAAAPGVAVARNEAEPSHPT